MTEYREQGVVFNSRGNRLVGITTLPAECAETAVLVLVGGPQYRVGSHRQFTLLARTLAEAGIASLRFDYSGMGDSEGERQEFQEVEHDISAALDTLKQQVPGLKSVVLWGLCDAASAAMIYASRWPMISGLVLLNPWVHSGDYSPAVKLSHYYVPLIRGTDTWKRIFSRQIDVLPALKEFVSDSALLLKRSLGLASAAQGRHSLVSAMLQGLGQFRGKSLVILSQQDLTAQEFQGLVGSDRSWQKLMSSPGIEVCEVAEADHTFSSKAWRDSVAQHTIALVRLAKPLD